MTKYDIQYDKGWAQFVGPNLGYMEDLYDLYKKDKTLVPENIRLFFEKWGEPNYVDKSETSRRNGGTKHTSQLSYEEIANAFTLSEGIRSRGHLIANISPLEERAVGEDFSLDKYNLTAEILRIIPANIISPFAPPQVKNGYEAVEHLLKVYTDTLAFEINQVQNMEERNWLKEKIESKSYQPHLSKKDKRFLLERLNKVEGFEHFLHKKFIGQKRFSIEGLDSIVPMLDDAVKESVQNGTENIMIGMAHRGRLNVLAHVLSKPYEIIFSEFHDAPNKELVPSEGSIGINYGWTGDVKYHLGADKEIKGNAKGATLTLANNPSHLEFVNPVVEGFTRAAQDNRDKKGYATQDVTHALAILIHGDAAFPGQGIVAETLNLGKLKGYSTGGTIHIIANNIIGFTTISEDSRSTNYASDLAKGFEIPIIHVNADDPEACLAAIHLAIQYRNTFHKDIIIDLVGYRRFGHNEMDEPLVTQPKLYKKIKKHETVCQIYEKKLKEQSVVSEDTLQSMREKYLAELEQHFKKVKDGKKSELKEEDTLPPPPVQNNLDNIDTMVNVKVLKDLNEQLLAVPKGFRVFPKLKKILERRRYVFEKDETIDWAHSEALAFATIIRDGTPIRLTGQDSERGTFSQRHLVLHDYENEKIYSPLHELREANASFDIYNSPLSEGACVGFEYGYNVYSPETLTLWEAQYGDFANGAQVLFDQFISGGRAKWGQKSGIVFLLPHGYEGQGPEHSSGRLERFLQLAAENNWHVVNLTRASQYFHLLRRQAKLLGKEEVRPLVIMTPKSLLRNKLLSSSADEFINGTFNPLIIEQGKKTVSEKVKKIIFCSGKIAIDIEEHINKHNNIDSIVVARVEELYPFPKEKIIPLTKKYGNVTEWIWVQEEPKNMGAWHYVLPQLRRIKGDHISIQYIGRRRMSSTAEGDAAMHKKEQERIINEALYD
ncbi:2-oxoglutarate dehydrogenase E1 component [Evansella cellulosilytica]|uniref:2-oxoglutarate dehydrogenase E1 component n=1 Tax=Evansella cellulosilytica (strain ATCC 21833 / DSM 2522 / FERM P-1141 / JCM 9156 / N-4) TaxID=649639 RepID=E6U0A4_EVAC2|nr:2-oxoglutarate dehydrogenase E1 component [Evansella cellulosilytica]ADU30220.1 2-oxoglutarate dehydrogenase, E1 subunit [Evansella cellulosilytica DSM 2522]